MTWVFINDPGVPGYEPFTGEMSRYKITNAQYCQFLNDVLASGDITVGVDNIVYGATAFCNYYGYGYRLPTEWEWQAVADYDGSYTYGCGVTIDHNKANYDNDNPLGLSSYPYTSPVNHYPSYGYGMNDMGGNVWEWTSTVFASYRVFRGGSWDLYDYYCTVSNRDGFTPDFTIGNMGFRVCR